MQCICIGMLAEIELHKLFFGTLMTLMIMINTDFEKDLNRDFFFPPRNDE